MKKNGFTLIELLAVIIILGILMIIAIPSVTKYISDSRKNAYVDTAKEIVAGTRNVVNEGKLEMYSTDTTYYIPSSYIKTENASKSPYGEFVHAYVGVIYDGKGYKYYWISVDESGQGVKKLEPSDKLDIDDIESDIKEEEITNLIENVGIGERNYIKILDSNGTWKDSHMVYEHVGENGGNKGILSIVYPSGKNKETVTAGDLVSIGSEQFYVIKHEGNDLVLLSRYNLKVGYFYSSSSVKTGEYSSSDPGYGMQSSDSSGWVSGASIYYGTIEFSRKPLKNYWDGKVGSVYPGNYCTNSTTGTNCVYVYDNNSYLYQFIEDYKSYFIDKGIEVKNARLMNLDELNILKNVDNIKWKETTYWLGNAFDNSQLWTVHSDGTNYRNSYYDANRFGLRPVIII